MTREAVFYLPTGAEARTAGVPGRLAVDGLEVVEVFGDGGGAARSGLARALGLIAAGEAGVLVVAQLRDAASSLGELVWLARYGRDEQGKELFAKPDWNGGKLTFELRRDAQRAIDQQLANPTSEREHVSTVGGYLPR